MKFNLLTINCIIKKYINNLVKIIKYVLQLFVSLL